MDTRLNTAGYNLYEVSSDEWIFDSNTGPFYAGSFRDVVSHMAQIGFQLDEIETAVRNMVNEDYNGAHFGMYKCFLFSFQKDFNNSKVS